VSFLLNLNREGKMNTIKIWEQLSYDSCHLPKLKVYEKPGQLQGQQVPLSYDSGAWPCSILYYAIKHKFCEVCNCAVNNISNLGNAIKC